MVQLNADDVSVSGRLQNASLSVRSNEVLGLIGPNGSGKSTLMACLAGLIEHDGAVEFNQQNLDGIDPRVRARSLGFLPQRSHSAWDLTVRDVVALGRLPWGDQDSDPIKNAMELANITIFAERPIHRLSGGEQARVWLARVFAGQPQVLLADEPVASLDLLHQKSILQSLKHYAAAGNAVIVALHDLSLAARYCNRVLLLNQGQIVACGAPETVLQESLLAKVYGLDLHVDLQSDPPIVIAR